MHVKNMHVYTNMSDNMHTCLKSVTKVQFYLMERILGFASVDTMENEKLLLKEEGECAF